jgi:hypothetical protein
MCISYTGYPEKAKEDIIGYKLFISNSKGKIGSLFRTLTTKEVRWHETKNYPNRVNRLYPMPEGKLLKSRLFDMGHGFSLFSTTKEAEKFIKDFRYCKTLSKTRTVVLRKVIIPKGTLFEEGRIKEGFIGERLSAIRAEKIIIIKET